jgi:hypothetical protein
MVDQRGERGGRRAWQAIIGEGRPLGQVRHDIRGEEFTGLFVIPIAIDQQVDAGVLVLSDQVDGLGQRTKKSAQRSASSQPLALRRRCGVVPGEKPTPDMGLFDLS